MSVSSTFFSLYDKTANPVFAGHQVTRGAFDVTEHEQNATLVMLSVNKAGAEFVSFNHDLVKGMKDMTETRSSYLHDSDCDGIAFVSHNDVEGIVVAELKSRFSTKHICKAYSQIVFSFLKLHAMLSLCNGYAIGGLTIHFVVSCKCFQDELQEESVMNRISKVEMADPDSFEGKLLRKLLSKHRMTIKIGEIASIYGLAINPVVADKEITLALQLTNAYADNSAVYVM